MYGERSPGRVDFDGRTPDHVDRPFARARWHRIEHAAHLLGVTRRTIRRRIRDGTLTGLYHDGQWRVLLVQTDNDEPHGIAQRVPSRQAQDDIDEITYQREEWQSLMSLVRDLQRTNMELAGQVGYLQGQLKPVHDRMHALEEPDWGTVYAMSLPSELEEVRSAVNTMAEQQERHESQIQEEFAEVRRSMASLMSTFDDRLEYRNLLLYDRLLASAAEERERRGLWSRLFRR